MATVERVTGKPVDRKRLGGEGAWIDYSGPPGHVRYVPFSRAVKRTFKPGSFRNRIVVIGAVAPSLQDRHPTSWPAGEMAGPEIHANAIDTLLRGAPLHDTGDTADLLIALALTLLPLLLGILLRPFVALGARPGRGGPVRGGRADRVRARADPAGGRAAGRARRSRWSGRWSCTT